MTDTALAGGAAASAPIFRGGTGFGRLSPVITPLVLALLPLAIFLAFFHPATLRIDNPGWLIHGSDNGENALGAHTYWHDAAAGASLRTRLLNAPDGVSVLFTDSNPLLTLAVKPFAALLPADAQFVGPFILLSLVLQALFAWLLLRRHAPGPLALWAGVALLAFPPTLFNRFVHANLVAHWTILAAFWLFLDPARGSRLRWWLPLIAATALIHSYLLLMVGAIWAATMLDRFVRGTHWDRIAVAGDGVAVLALVAAIAWWLGVGGQMPTHTFGRFAMPLDALWNPGLQAFTNLLPAYERRSSQDFEGFQYLGAGGLLLLAAAIAIAMRVPSKAAEQRTLARLRLLVPALGVLAILAILRVPLPAAAMDALDPIRASGRLFWPVGYAVVFVAILTAFRLSAERAGLLLLALVAIQVTDLAGMAAAMRSQTAAAADHRLYTRTNDPRWQKLVASADAVTFIPGDVTRDLAAFQEIAWRAANVRTPVTNVYAARIDRRTVARLRAERARFDAGALDPHRLYVLLADVPLPGDAAPRRLRLDGLTVLVPGER